LRKKQIVCSNKQTFSGTVSIARFAPALLAGLIQLTCVQNPEKSTFDLLLLNLSLDFYMQIQQESSIDEGD